VRAGGIVGKVRVRLLPRGDGGGNFGQGQEEEEECFRFPKRAVGARAALAGAEVGVG